MSAHQTEPVTTSEYFEKEIIDDSPLMLSGPGERLRKQRELLGLTLPDVAAYLNLRTTILEALEDNDYKKIPRLVFARGYLRSYAKLLNLPGEEIIEAFNSLKWPESKTEFLVQPLRMKSKKASTQKHFSMPWIALLFIVAIFIIASFWRPITQTLITPKTHGVTHSKTASKTTIAHPVSEEPKHEASKSILPDVNSSFNQLRQE